MLNKRYLIAGVSKSGYSVCDYLLKRGIKCCFFEEQESEKIAELTESLISRGARRVDYEWVKNNINAFDTLILSPGIAINHRLPVLFRNNDKEITGEFDFSVENIRPTFVAVTGTNGKTTTVSLIDHILRRAGRERFAVGNIGVPISSKIEEFNCNSIAVCEISSFQLETVSKFAPQISCVLNITPDHLDRHYTMENYVFLKRKLLQNCQKDDYIILNYDDERVREFSLGLNANIIFVSTKIESDCYSDGENFIYKGERISGSNDCTLSGEHNVYNILFAIAVCRILGVDSERIREGLSTFKGVKHRIEFIKEVNGIYFYNDSKATNSASTVTAISSISKPTVLILGGSEKNEDYGQLFQSVRERGIKHVVLTGKTIWKMLDSAMQSGYYSVSVIPDFDIAVKFAYKIAERGDVVLLSPACASFDCFSGYEERGERFCEIVNGLNGDE